MREIKVTKKPYRNKRFTRVVKDFEKQGLKQLKLQDELEALCKSASMEEILNRNVTKDKNGEIETFAEIFEIVKIDNYKLYNDIYKKDGRVNSRGSIYKFFK